MSSTNKTTYYELPQYVDNDIFNPLQDANDAYEKIDTALHNIANAEADDASEIVGVKSRLDSAEGDIDDLEAQNGNDELTTIAQTLSGAVNELDADVASLNGKLDDVEDDINNVSTGLKAKVSALETQNGSEVLTTTANTLSGAVNELDGDIVDINTEITAMKQYFYNVKEHGAKGDGVTDDTTALQDAIDYGIANHVTVFIPKGTYIVSESLRINAPVMILGENEPPVEWANLDGASTIKYIGTGNEACIAILSDTENTWTDDSTISSVTNVHIKNIRLFSESRTCGIVAHGYEIVIENCNVHGFKMGIMFKYSYLIDIKNCFLSIAGIGVYLYHTSTLTNITGGWINGSYDETALDNDFWDLIFDKSSFNQYHTAIMLNNNAPVTMRDVAIERANYGFQLTNGSKITADKLNMESVRKAGIFIANPSEMPATFSNIFSIIKLNDANFYNSNYESGFYWFAVNDYYTEIHANLVQWVNNCINKNVNQFYFNACGIFDITSPAYNFGSVYEDIGLNHQYTSGYVENNSKYVDDGYEVDITIGQDTVWGGTQTDQWTLNLPYKKKYANGVWTANEGYKLFGYAYLRNQTSKKYDVRVTRWGNVAILDETGDTPLTYEMLHSDVVLLRLTGKFRFNR